MLNLAEYKKRPARLADYLPWAAIIAPGIVLNKDGSFQRTIRYRGPLLDLGNVVILEPQPDTLFILSGLAEVYGTAGQVIP